MNLKGNLILALETGIEGGSISIWDYHLGIEIESSTGENSLSKSEDVLEIIDILFGKHSINKNDFNSVVLATGIGSATGLKIGEATAKGLARSLNCSCKQIALWDVLAEIAAKKSSSKIKKVYLPAGKGRIISRLLNEKRFSGDAEIINFKEFYNDLQNSAEADCFVYEELIDDIRNYSGVTHIRRNLATYVGKVASDNDKNL